MTVRKRRALDVAQIGIMSATLSAGKMALAFLPNIEVVSLLIIFYSIYFGRKALLAVFVFIAAECLIWGIGLWTIMYIYVWPLLAVVAWILRKKEGAMFWAAVSGIYGLAFGGLCSLVYVFTGGLETAFGWWIAGIPMDITHCVGNFVLMLVLYRPLKNVMERIARR